MDSKEMRPKVGVGVMILKDGKVLLGKRLNAHGAGDWAFPGGHLEYKESFVQCATRETKEESGVDIKNIRFQFVANVMDWAPKHYLHIGMVADWADGEPRALEPEKCERWDWFPLDALPEPLFRTCAMAKEVYKSGQVCFDLKTE